MQITDSKQIRSADEIMLHKYEFPGILLMENAGLKSTGFILQKFPDKKQILILAGPGNNGGDGLVIARRLWLEGKNVSVLFANDPATYKGDTRTNFNILQKTPIPFFVWGNKNIPEAILFPGQESLLIDAILGTGISDKLRGNPAEMIAHFSSQGLDCVAIDLPSGLNADTGNALNISLQATCTITFQFPKICHVVTPASDFCGEVVVCNIGIYPAVSESLSIRRNLITSEIVKSFYRPRNSNSHKGNFGHLLLC